MSIWSWTCFARPRPTSGTPELFLSEHAPLMRAGILQKTDDPQSPSGSSGLAQFLNLDSRILGFLLGRNHIDRQLIDLARLHSPSFAVDDLCC